MVQDLKKKIYNEISTTRINRTLIDIIAKVFNNKTIQKIRIKLAHKCWEIHFILHSRRWKKMLLISSMTALEISQSDLGLKARRSR